MLFVNWKILLFAVGAVLVLLVGCAAYGAKRHVIVQAGDQEVRLTLPPIWKQFVQSHATITRGKRLVAELRTGLFEGPIVLFTTGSTEAICVYENDVSIETLAFDMEHVTPTTATHPIVARSEVEWRRLQGGEIQPVIERLRTMSNDEFRRLSAPSLDLGVCQIFRSRVLIANRLAKAARSSTRVDI